MFNFIEKKSFFYFSAIITLIILIGTFVNVIGFYKNEIMLISATTILIAMMIFYQYKYKEILKALVPSLLTIGICARLEFFYQVLIDIGHDSFSFASDSIRITIRNSCSLITTILMFVIFVNHFVLNYNGKASKIAININKVAVILMVISAITDVCSVFIASSVNNSMNLILNVHMLRNFTVNLFGLFASLTVVSTEAFINSRRAEKELSNSAA